MSTILKALKKLEQETQAAANAALPAAQGESGADTLPVRSRLWIGIGLGASLLSLVLVLYVLLRPTAPPPDGAPQGQAVPPVPSETVKAPEDALPIPEVYPPRQPGEPETATTVHPPSAASAEYANDLKAAAESESRVAATTGSTAAGPPPASGGSPVAPSIPSGPSVPGAPPAVSAPPSGNAAAAPVSASDSASLSSEDSPAPQEAAAVEVADPYDDVPRLEPNSPIDLQAISWAETQAERIAVINNVILHEGDSVEGYYVVKIRPDDVVLRRNGRMWRAKFAVR